MCRFNLWGWRWTELRVNISVKVAATLANPYSAVQEAPSTAGPLRST